MKQRGVFLIGIITMGIYFFLFPHSSGKEMVLTPVSYTQLTSDASLSGRSDDSTFSVRTRETAGYFDSQKELSAFYQGRKIAVHDDWIALSNVTDVSILDPDGRLRSRISDRGVPIERNGQLYLYSGNIGRVAKVDPTNGLVQWSMDFLSPLTVLDGTDGRTLLGFLDGRILVVEEDGEVKLRYRPGGSRVEAVYGGALSSNGTSAAIISGLDPQRFILLEERKNGFRPAAHHDTGTDTRRSVAIGFVSDDNRVLYEIGDAVAAVDTSTYDIEKISLTGRPVSWDDDTAGGSLVLMGVEDGSSHLRILSKYDLTFFEGSLPGEASGVRMLDNSLLLTGDGYLGIMEMTVR